jgi:putative phage-type endonuclease
MNIDQGAEWMAERIGHVTASRLADVLATVKSGEAASRANYRAELVAQRLTGRAEESYTNSAMQRGIDEEPIARTEYELRSGLMVSTCGFIKHPTIEWAGASPDGLVLDDGCLEIKNPNTATHISYLLGKVPPAKYKPQMLWQVVCTGRKWCDFVSYDSRMPDDLAYFCVRYTPTDEEKRETEEAVMLFLAQVDMTIQKLRNL